MRGIGPLVNIASLETIIPDINVEVVDMVDEFENWRHLMASSKFGRRMRFVGGAVWSVIAKLRGLPKIQTFLWLLCHSKILTNVERARRHMTNNSSCPVCAYPVEDIHHILRLCPVAHVIWGHFVRCYRLDEFLNLELKE
ncbi:hypothetical protein V6N11_067944 [Hibiscus sabdariffa]|uniref:Reverse transcriptase zinc-binding domain-containing protein n=1 Tax=Hibiscus sabdariffa TaxID=183260 RepID=A0ABR2SSX0_9ROSI